MIWRSILVFLALLVGLVLVLPVVLVALGLAAVAGLTRLIASGLQRSPRAAQWRELVQYEPVVGWRPRPNLDTYAWADDVFHLTIGPDGWRGKLPLAQADVVVFGDSFSFGHGADDRDMYTEFCGGLRVKSIGSDGYDMVHGLLWMQRLAPELAGKLVVWFVYYGNDLHENLLPNMGKYRMPYVRQRGEDGGWEVVTDHVSPEPWPFRSPTSYHPIMADFSCPTPFSRRVFSACEYLVSEAHAICERAGAQLAVVGVPDRVQLTRRGRAKLARLAPRGQEFDVHRPDKQLGEICRRLDIPFVPLSAQLTARDYLVHDIHWRRSGHRKVGAVLKRLHQEAQLPTPPFVHARLVETASAAGRS